MSLTDEEIQRLAVNRAPAVAAVGAANARAEHYCLRALDEEDGGWSEDDPSSDPRVSAIAKRGNVILSTRLDLRPRVLLRQPRKPSIAELRAQASPTGGPLQPSGYDSYEFDDRETASVITVRVSKDRTTIEVVVQGVSDVPRIFIEVGEVVVEIPAKPGCAGSFEMTIGEDSDLASDLITALENPEATVTLHVPRVPLSKE